MIYVYDEGLHQVTVIYIYTQKVSAYSTETCFLQKGISYLHFTAKKRQDKLSHK